MYYTFIIIAHCVLLLFLLTLLDRLPIFQLLAVFGVLASLYFSLTEKDDA